MGPERSYETIIDLPHHQSAVRPHMLRPDRAAQFAPFAALTGYDEAVRETARLTERRIELTEDEMAILDSKLRRALREHIPVCITYFQPDERKAGGAYVQAAGLIAGIDSVKGAVLLDTQTLVPIREITGVEDNAFIAE